MLKLNSINIIEYDTNSFDKVYNQVYEEIMNIHNKNTPLIVIGVSYGGLIATQLYKKINVILSISIASPLKHNKFLHFLKKKFHILYGEN